MSKKKKTSTTKKNQKDWKGMKITQNTSKSEFIQDYLAWKRACTGIKSGKMMVQGIPTLYDFLVEHVTSTSMRTNSRNRGHVNSGANKYIKLLDNLLERKFYTVGDEMIIKNLGDALMALKGTGKDTKESPALDPGFILFTESKRGRRGQKLAPKVVQGHYRTEAYAKKNKTSAAPPHWFTGTNLPHKALFNESADDEFKSRGLAVIMQDVKGKLADITNEVEDIPIPEDDNIQEYEALGDIENFFDKVVRNVGFWNKDGRLLVGPLKREFENTQFKLGIQDQDVIREFPRLKQKDAPAGKITSVTFEASPLTLVTLVDRALIRQQPSGRNGRSAPNDQMAWQNAIRTGFDYRIAGEEELVFPVNSVRIAKELAKIPEIRRFAQGLLRKTNLYNGPNFQTSNAAKLLAEKKFNYSPTSQQAILNLFRKEKAQPKSIQLKLTKNAMKALLNQSVITRTRDLQSMNAPNTDEKIVLKNMWQSLLWS
tara:strand:+ start:1124 stop:2575 length:1452 start_codon:yes stop_codon:yes gene_type:complete